MNKNQVRIIIKILKDKATDGRPPLKQVFEQGSYLWATNGYVVIEVGEVKDDLKGKRITLEALQAWNATHTKKGDRVGDDLFEDNPYDQPDMKTLLHQEYQEPTENPMFDVNLLKTACDYLGITKVSLEQSTTNPNCYRVKPLDEDEMDITTKAMESNAYVMGVMR